MMTDNDERVGSGGDGSRSVMGECRNIASRGVITKILASSDIPACQVSNVLVRDPQKLWLSDIGMPQHITLHFAEDYASGFAASDGKIRTFGWYCWHSYTSNPAEIIVRVSKNGKVYRDLCDIEGSSRAGIHLRSIDPPLDVRVYPYVRLLFRRNYGGDRVYVNRLYLYRETLEKVEADVQRLLSSKVKDTVLAVAATAVVEANRSSSEMPRQTASRDPVDNLIRKIERARRGNAREIRDVLRGGKVVEAEAEGNDGEEEEEEEEEEEKNVVRHHDPPGLRRAVADAKRRSSSISGSLFVADAGDTDEHDRLRRQLKEMELLVGKCAKHRRSRAIDIVAVAPGDSRSDVDRSVVTSRRDKSEKIGTSSANDDRLGTCIRSIDKMERRVSRLTKAMGAIVTQLDLGKVVGPEDDGENASGEDEGADDIFNTLPRAVSTPSPRRRRGDSRDKKAPPAVTPLQRELQPLLERILTSWATQLLTAQSESMRRRLDHRLKLERQQMLSELMKAQRNFTEKWSSRQMKKFEHLVRQTVHEASTRRRSGKAQTTTGAPSPPRRPPRRKAGSVPDEDTLEKLVSRRARKLARLAAAASVPMALRKYNQDRDVDDEIYVDTELDNEVDAILRDEDSNAVDGFGNLSLYNERREGASSRPLPRTKKSSGGRSRSRVVGERREPAAASSRSRRRGGDLSLRRAFVRK